MPNYVITSIGAHYILRSNSIDIQEQLLIVFLPKGSSYQVAHPAPQTA